MQQSPALLSVLPPPAPCTTASYAHCMQVIGCWLAATAAALSATSSLSMSISEDVAEELANNQSVCL